MNSSAKDTLQVLLDHYEATRQVGHTTTMLNGARGIDCHVLVGNYAQGEQIQNLAKKSKRARKFTAVTMHDLQWGKLRGTKKPLIIDNGALYGILQDAVRTIKAQESVIRRIKNAVADIK